MHAHHYDYAVLRVVPRTDREEFFNAGIILWCAERDFLDAAIELDERRLAAFDVTDASLARRHLDGIQLICRGGPDAGPIGKLPPRQRFDWLVAPRSTLIQTSPVHSGRCREPAEALRHLIDVLVKPALHKPAPHRPAAS